MTVVHLRRLILEFSWDGIQLRTLYRTRSGSGPSTKARRREVEQLARGGLERALEALEEGPAECIGTAGFETREDTLHAEASPFLSERSNNVKQRKGG